MEKIISQNNPLRHTNKKFLLVFIGLILVFFGGVNAASAATMYFSPSSGSHTVGQTFSVGLYVSTPDKAMNAAQGIINFPTDKLEATNISKTGSIITNWVQEPFYSNTDGTVNFAGVVTNPGFIGQSGKLLSVTFSVKDTGEASLNLIKGSILANDGLATQILTAVSDANFYLEPETEGPGAPESITPIVGGPSAAIISSPTHPNPEKWYSNSNPRFVWSLADDVTAVKLLYSKYPDSRPAVIYSPAVSEKQLENIADGIWYFHVQLKNKDGWGAIPHFRFQIDTKPPQQFAIEFLEGKESDNPRPTVVFETTDSLSGIDYYKVKIDEGDFFVVSAETVKGKPYILPLQSPGKRTILVQAYDKAGNYSTASEEFTTIPLKSPVITEYSQKLQSGEFLTAKGKTDYPRSEVIIYLQREKEDVKSKRIDTDKEGNFVFTSPEKLTDGIYKLWAEAVDERGARSEPSEKLTVLVERLAILKIGSWVIDLLVVIIPLIALVILLGFMIWYVWHKLFRFKKEVKKEVREAEEVLHKAFDFLREEIKTQIKVLEKAQTKRQLTEEEEKIFNRLKKDLEAVERVVKKEIEDIKKEVE